MAQVLGEAKDQWILFFFVFLFLVLIPKLSTGALYLFIYLFIYLILMAAPVAYGGSQAKRAIRAVAGSELYL